MRKYVAAALVGLALVGTQAAAADGAVQNADEREGSSYGYVGGVPLYAFLYGAAFFSFIGWAATQNGGAPASP